MTTENTSEQVCESTETTVETAPKVAAVALEPDLGFIDEVAELSGADNFEKCYQCATCSGTCPISPDNNPFPRKEMVWSMWGLQDRLIKDPDVWLCYQCNDCSTNCPRGAQPGVVLGAIRSLVYKHYAVPGIMGTLASSPKYLPVLLAIPVVILAFFLGITGHLNIPEGDIVFANFFPYIILDPIFIVVSLFATVATAMSAWNFWKGLHEGPRPPLKEGAAGLVAGLTATAIEILPHSNFNECGTSKDRYVSHMLTFYGFMALFVTTSAVFVGIYVFGMETPLAPFHPVKILGNLGAVAFLIGTGMMLLSRLTDNDDSHQSTYADWQLIGLMLALAVTGILSQVFRVLGTAFLAYATYFIHLVLVFCMMGYFPYSKFAHILYRTLGILYYKSYCEPVRRDTQ